MYPALLPRIITIKYCQQQHHHPNHYLNKMMIYPFLLLRIITILIVPTNTEKNNNNNNSSNLYDNNTLITTVIHFLSFDQNHSECLSRDGNVYHCHLILLTLLEGPSILMQSLHANCLPLYLCV